MKLVRVRGEYIRTCTWYMVYARKGGSTFVRAQTIWVMTQKFSMLLFIVPAWWNWWCIVRGEYIRTCTFGLRAKVARTDHMVIILVSFRRSVGCVCAGVEYIYAHTHIWVHRKGGVHSYEATIGYYIGFLSP